MRVSALQLFAPSALLRVYTFHTPHMPVAPEFRQVKFPPGVARLSIQMTFTSVDVPAREGIVPDVAEQAMVPFGHRGSVERNVQLAPKVSEYFV
jgi:hypothetical protein